MRIIDVQCDHQRPSSPDDTRHSFEHTQRVCHTSFVGAQQLIGYAREENYGQARLFRDAASEDSSG